MTPSTLDFATAPRAAYRIGWECLYTGGTDTRLGGNRGKRAKAEASATLPARQMGEGNQRRWFISGCTTSPGGLVRKYPCLARRALCSTQPPLWFCADTQATAPHSKRIATHRLVVLVVFPAVCITQVRATQSIHLWAAGASAGRTIARATRSHGSLQTSPP